MPENQRTSQEGRSFIEAARRAQIVGCAIDAIAEQGYAQATLERIARRAGISRGLISYHFDGREDLMAQVVVDVFSAGAAYMVPRIEAASTAPAKLRTYIESNLAFMGEHRTRMLALVRIFAGSDLVDGPPGLDADAVEAGLEGLRQILREGQRVGDFRSFDVRLMATAIRNVIDGVPPQMAADPDLDLDVVAREVTTLFELATRAEGDVDERGNERAPGGRPAIR